MLSNELKNKILKDLKKTGIGSELQAGKTIIENGWFFEGTSYYFDEDEKQSRETDFTASVVRDIPSMTLNDGAVVEGEEPIGDLVFSLCGDVKKSEKPWIVLKRHGHEDDLFANHDSLFCSNSAIDTFHLTAHMHEHIQMLGNIEGTNIHEFCKSPNNKPRWFGAFVSACKASEYGLKLFQEDLANFDASRAYSSHFVQPVVILDGDLFLAYLDSEGTTVVEDVEFAHVIFGFRTLAYNRGSYRVDVVRLEALEKYLDYCSEVASEMALYIALENTADNR